MRLIFAGMALAALIFGAACSDKGAETRTVSQATRWEMQVPADWDLSLPAPGQVSEQAGEPTAMEFVQRQLQLAAGDETFVFFLALLHDGSDIDIEQQAALQAEHQADGPGGAALELEGPPEVRSEAERTIVEFRARGEPHPSGDGDWQYRYTFVQSPALPQEAWLLTCASNGGDAGARCDAAIDSFTLMPPR